MSALPDLSGLALVPRGAPVGVFHQLEEEDLETLWPEGEGYGEGCAISHERLKAKTAPNTGVGEEHAVFRVRKHEGVDDPTKYDGVEQYHFYFAKKLAEWARRQIALNETRDKVLDPQKGGYLRRSDVDLLLDAYPDEDSDTVGAGQITELVRSGGGDELGEVPEFVRTAPLKEGLEYTAFAPFRRDASFSWMLEQTIGAFGEIVDTAEYFRIELEMKWFGDTVEKHYWTELEGWIDAAAGDDENQMTIAFANGLVKRSGAAAHVFDDDRQQAIVKALLEGEHVRVTVQRSYDDMQSPDSVNVTVDITKQAMRMLVIRSAVGHLPQGAPERRRWEAEFRARLGRTGQKNWADWTTIANASASNDLDRINGERYCWAPWISENAPCAPNSAERYNSWRGALSQMVSAVHCVCNAAERRGMEDEVPMRPFDYYVPSANQPRSLPAEVLAASGPRGALDAFYGRIDKVGVDLAKSNIRATAVQDARPKRTFAQAFAHLVGAQSQWRPVMQTNVPIWYLVSNDWMRAMDARWDQLVLARRAAQAEGDGLDDAAPWLLDHNDPHALRVRGRGRG